MNLFAVNAAEVNGSIEVWSWYGDAALTVDMAGDVVRGITIAGDAQVAISTTLEPQLRVIPGQQPANIQVSAAGEALIGRTGQGSAQIVLSAAGSGTRWTFGESAADIVIEADGDAIVVQPAAASFNVVISTSLDGMVSRTVTEYGAGAIIFDGLLEQKVAGKQMIEAAAEIHLASVGSGHLIIDGPAADADIKVLAGGEARLGDQVFIEGDASIELFARGSIGYRHYEYGEGVASISITAAALQAGIPPIPGEYMPAPAARTITVQRDAREYSVPRQSRSIA